LFGQKASFICVLLYLFAPSIWVLNLMGHPVLFSIFFFNLGLYLLSRAHASSHQLNLFPSLLAFSCFALALCFRFDILFNALFVLSWLVYKKCFHRTNVWKLSVSAVLLIVIYIGFKGILYGKLNPVPVTFTNHAYSNYSPASFAKNIALLTFGVNPFFILLFILGLVLWIKQKKWNKIVLVVSWIVPILVIALFRDMDLARIATIVYPAFFLPTTSLISQIKKKNILITLSLIGASQIISILLYKPVISHYQFKYYRSSSSERVITERVPLGGMFSDHYYMIQRNRSLMDLARKVASIQNKPIFVVGDQTIFFKYAVITSLNDYTVSVIPLGNSKIWKVVSPTNTYLFIQLWGNESLWHAIIKDEKYRQFNFFFIPSDRIRYPSIQLPEKFQELTSGTSP
jgi:hypothetical protein